jgi:hypothetical protein
VIQGHHGIDGQKCHRFKGHHGIDGEKFQVKPTEILVKLKYKSYPTDISSIPLLINRPVKDSAVVPDESATTQVRPLPRVCDDSGTKSQST